MADLTITVRRGPVAGAFADRSLLVKTVLAAVCMAVVALGVGVLSINRMGTLRDDLRTMKDSHVDSLQQVANIRGELAEMFRGMLVYNIGQVQGSATDQRAGRQSVRDADARMDTGLAAYTAIARDSPDRLDALRQFTAAVEHYRALRDTALFGEPMAAGYTMPAPDRIGAEFNQVETAMAEQVQALQQAEDTEADEMAADGADAYDRARLTTILALGIGMLLSAFVCVTVLRLIKPQLTTVSTALEAVAEGDLTVPAEVRSRDELGAMAYAVNRARDGLRGTVTALTAGAQTLGEGTARLTSVTARLAEGAHEAAQQAGVVAASAGDVSTSVQSAASGSDQMSASIRQIAENANSAAQVASSAVGVAQATNDTVAKLGESSEEIGNVVKTITQIAEQTNLLALNATIEAARAGESGKGFAVVATEVKDLAQETAKATEDISHRVEAIQADTSRAVDAIGDISRVISEINDYQVTIASAVEEQTATTNEMSRSIGDAAHGSSSIAGNITVVAEAVQAQTGALNEADQSVGELTQVADELRAVVARFRV